MKIEPDEATDFLRVDEEGLAALAQVIPALQEQKQNGVDIGEEGEEALALVATLPGLAEALPSLSDPLYLLNIARTNRESMLVSRCWVRGEGSIVALFADAGESLIFGVSPAQLPSLVAGLINLGARDEAAANVGVDGDVLDGLFSGDASVRAASLDSLGMPEDGWAWQLQAVSPEQADSDDPDPTGVRIGVDSTKGLRHLVAGSAGQGELASVSPLDLWTDLIAFLLPDPVGSPSGVIG